MLYSRYISKVCSKNFRLKFQFFDQNFRLFFLAKTFFNFTNFKFIANIRQHNVTTYGAGKQVQVNEDSLSPPVSDFIQEYVQRNMAWIQDCVNGQRLCTELLGY